MLLKLENIGKIYDSNDILTVGIRGIDLAFDYNELVTIEGESGSGKSTLLNVIGVNILMRKGSCTSTASRLRTTPKAIGRSTAKRTSPPSFRTSIS